MFSGIVSHTGTIKEIIDRNGDKSFVIHTGGMNLEHVVIGDSICINGACLTITDKKNDCIQVDVSAETLLCTAFDHYDTGKRTNLEKALKLTDRLNGHIVSGHVDCVGTIVSFNDEARSTRYLIDVPSGFRRYLCKKGSICVDGVSLTINLVNDSQVSLNVIPYTREHTIFSDYAPGTKVNIEIDLIARYLESLYQDRQ